MMRKREVRYYIKDAQDRRYEVVVADADYEPAFRRHAAWWMRGGYRTIPTTDPRAPVKPFNIIIIER